MTAMNHDKHHLDIDALRECLRGVMDPEVGMNIVDLGLVYRLALESEGLVVEMTMTSPACPMGDMITEDVRDALRRVLPATVPLEVRLVWEPPWGPERMSDVARQHFGQ